MAPKASSVGGAASALADAEGEAERLRAALAESSAKVDKFRKAAFYWKQMCTEASGNK